MKLKNIKPIKQGSGGSVKLGFGNTTIASHGCLITCLVMQLSHYNKSFTLAGLNDLLRRINAFSGSYISWPAFIEYFNFAFEWVKEGDFVKMVKEGLDYGDPVIIRIKEKEHFVLAIGYGQSITGDLLINDPLAGETYWLKAKGWSIKSLRVLTPLNKPTDPEGGTSDAYNACIKARDGFQEEIGTLKKRLETSERTRKKLGDEVKKLMAENADLVETVLAWQKEGKLDNEEIKNVMDQYQILGDELESVKTTLRFYRRYYDKRNEKGFKTAMLLIGEGLKKLIEWKKSKKGKDAKQK